MADKFLNTAGGNINISNGSSQLFGSTVGAINLDPSQPIKTNSVRQLVSSKLDITDINNLEDDLNSLQYGKAKVLTYQVNVEKLTDLPTPINGVIYLLPNTTYIIMTHLDIGVNRLDCNGGIVGILGFSSEISSISSDNVGALITSNNSVILRWITLTSTAGSIFAMDGSLGPNPLPALDWIGVNFLNSTTIGYIKDYANFIGFSMAFLNSGNLTFDGTFGTIAFDTCIFTTPTGSSIIIPSTCIITRRFRINKSSFVITGSNNGINFSTSASITKEQYILIQCNFSGGATTYLAGVQSSDIKASFLNNFTIENSRTLANYYMSNNITETPITLQGTYYKIEGNTTIEPLTQRFDETVSNRAVYEGITISVFKIITTMSITGSNNINYATRIAKNGTTIVSTTSFFTSTGNGSASNITSQSIIKLAPMDYVEVFIANLTNTNNPTVVDMNVIITKIDT